MLCKKCGAQIRREDKRADGIYICPGCGTAYRAKPKPIAEGEGAKAARASAPKSAKSQSGATDAKRRGSAKRTKRAAPRVNWKRVGLAALCVCAVAALALLLPLGLGGREDRKAASTATQAATAAVPSPTASALPTVQPTPTPLPPASVHFRAVGDVMSHKLQLKLAYQKDGSFDYEPQFRYVKDALSKADYTIANLELSIAVDENYSSFPFFRTPEAILAALKDCGVDLLTSGNNHVLDGFWDGLVHTVDKVEEYGFDHLGAYRTKEEAEQPLVVDINGIRFGFLAYTLDVNGNDKRIDSDKAAFCVKRLADADFEADVRELRELGAEVVICLPHWGEENRRSVTNQCRNYAKRMVEAGVDVILGSHPHVVLPIDFGELDVNGEKKDVLIAWSMGNFISYMANQYVDSGIIVDFTVTRDEAGKIHIQDPGYVPVYVWGNSNVFHLLCSGDFYSHKPDGMTNDEFSRMKQSVREIVNMIGQDGIALLQN